MTLAGVHDDVIIIVFHVVVDNLLETASNTRVSPQNQRHTRHTHRLVFS